MAKYSVSKRTAHLIFPIHLQFGVRYAHTDPHQNTDSDDLWLQEDLLTTTSYLLW